MADCADRFQQLIICPDGNFSSWYFDSPVKPEWKYETYIAVELVQWVDASYKTIASKNGRAITGLSMSGRGALFLAVKRQQVFGAAGSMSGGVDIRPFANNWGIAGKPGSYSVNPDNCKKIRLQICSVR